MGKESGGRGSKQLLRFGTLEDTGKPSFYCASFYCTSQMSHFLHWRQNPPISKTISTHFTSVVWDHACTSLSVPVCNAPRKGKIEARNLCLFKFPMQALLSKWSLTNLRIINKNSWNGKQRIWFLRNPCPLCIFSKGCNTEFCSFLILFRT